MDLPCLKSISGFYVERYEIPEILFRGLIIDIETTSSRPESGEIIDFGIITDSHILTVAMKKGADQSDFYFLIRCFLEEAKRNGYRIYAYNAMFEKRWLESKVGWDGYIHDLMETPRKISDRITMNIRDHKYPKLRELFYPRFFFVYGIRRWDIDSSWVLEYWNRYRKTGDEKYIRWIAHHNLLDLISELEILLWQGMLDRLYSNIDTAMKHMKFKCEVCGRDTDPRDLVSVTYLEPKPAGKGYQFVEKAVCRECMKSIL